MVTVTVPVAADEVVEIVKVEEAPAVTDVGLKLAAAPEPSPLAESAMVWADPLVTAVLTV